MKSFFSSNDVLCDGALAKYNMDSNKKKTNIRKNHKIMEVLETYRCYL